MKDQPNLSTQVQKEKAQILCSELVEVCIEADRLYTTYGLLAQSGECGKWINTVREILCRILGQEQYDNLPLTRANL